MKICFSWYNFYFHKYRDKWTVSNAFSKWFKLRFYFGGMISTAAWTIIIGLSELGHYHYISKIGCELTHWGRVTQICVSKQTIIGSDDGLSPGRRQAIIWTNAGILLIGTLRTNFSEIFIEIRMFSFKKMGLKVSSAKRRLLCLGLNGLSHGWSCMLLQYRWWLKWIKTTSVRCGSTKYWIKLKSYLRGENKWNHKMGWLTSLRYMWIRAKTILQCTKLQSDGGDNVSSEYLQN